MVLQDTSLNKSFGSSVVSSARPSVALANAKSKMVRVLQERSLHEYVCSQLLLIAAQSSQLQCSEVDGKKLQGALLQSLDSLRMYQDGDTAELRELHGTLLFYQTNVKDRVGAHAAVHRSIDAVQRTVEGKLSKHPKRSDGDDSSGRFSGRLNAAPISVEQRIELRLKQLQGITTKFPVVCDVFRSAANRFCAAGEQPSTNKATNSTAAKPNHPRQRGQKSGRDRHDDDVQSMLKNVLNNKRR